MSEQVGDGVPVLEELIGLDWPRSDDTDVIESNTPYVYGYAGWFEPVNDVIEIGDELDQTVILHELTHRWFNDQMFSTRWINEGLAQELAAQAMAELDGDPEASKLPPSSDPGYQPLNTWSDPQLQSAATEAQEAYGYAASYAVVHEIVDDAGARSHPPGARGPPTRTASPTWVTRRPSARSDGELALLPRPRRGARRRRRGGRTVRGRGGRRSRQGRPR